MGSSARARGPSTPGAWDPPFRPAPAWTERFAPRGVSALATGSASASSVALAWFELTLASLGLGQCVVSSMVGYDYTSFLLGNSLAGRGRGSLVGVTLASLALPSVLVLALVVIPRWRSALPALERWGARLAPLALLIAGPALLDHQAWHMRPLPYLVMLSVVVLVGERLFQRSLATFDEGRWLPFPLTHHPAIARWLPRVVLVLAVGGFIAWGAYYSIQHHHKLRTSSFDLGIYDNLMYNALRGYPFRSPVLFGPGGGNYIAGHAEFTMLLFLPLYALFPRAETLLALQVILVACAAFPLYAFAKTQVPRWAAATLAVGYLLYAPMHGPLFYDFHWIMAAPFFHFLLFFSVARKKRMLTAVSLAILLLTREDIAVGTALFGVFLVLFSSQAATGVTIAVVSSVWFAVDKFVIMPWAGQWWFAELYRGLMGPGESGYGSVINTLLINPVFVVQTLLTEQKLTYIAHLLTPLAWLPARKLGLVLLACPGAFFTVLTTNYPPVVSIAFQYSAHWAGYLFAAAVFALRLLGQGPGGRLRQQALVLVTAVGITSHSYVFGGILERSHFIGGFQYIDFTMSVEDRARYAELKDVIARIPKDAVVAATDSEVPHVSNRELCYALREHSGDAEYLLINRNLLWAGNTMMQLRQALSRNQYGLVYRRGLFFLFKRDHAGEGTADAKRELGLPLQ